MFSQEKDYHTEAVPPGTFLDMVLKKGALQIVLKTYLISPGIFTTERN
jgi:hypothetical protein